MGDGEGVADSGRVVDPEEMGAAFGRRQAGRRGGAVAIVGGAAGQLPQEPLPGQPYEGRAAEGRDRGELRPSGQV